LQGGKFTERKQSCQEEREVTTQNGNLSTRKIKEKLQICTF
jgi:hypothetical protein